VFVSSEGKGEDLSEVLALSKRFAIYLTLVGSHHDQYYSDRTYRYF
jgi:hypothetical protein